MSVFDLFRNFFGLSERPNKWKNPPSDGSADQFHHSVWSDVDKKYREQDDIEADYTFDIFVNSVEIQRQFELQMNEMFKQLKMLQDPYMFDLGVPESTPIEPPSRSPRDEVLKPGYVGVDESSQKRDTDLDDHVSKYGLSSLLPGVIEPKLDVAVPTRITGQSVTRKVIQRPDGSIEREEVVRDNAGNEQRTVTRSIGDQSHSVVTITSPNGVQTSETLQNIDQDKLDDFMKKWDGGQNQKPVERPKLKIIPDDFPFLKFFK